MIGARLMTGPPLPMIDVRGPAAGPCPAAGPETSIKGARGIAWLVLDLVAPGRGPLTTWRPVGPATI